MQNLPIRPTFIQRILFYSLFIILLISGLLWLYYFNFMNIESDYGFEVHPLTNLWLVTHGTCAIFFLVLFGNMINNHFLGALRIKKNRATGISFLILMIILILTGIGLYYFGGEKSQEITSLIHWVVGILSFFLALIHIWIGRYKRIFEKKIKESLQGKKF